MDRQHSILNAMYNTQQQMENIMHSPQLTTPDEKMHLIAMNFINFERFKIYSPTSSKIKIGCKINFRICYENPCGSLNLAKATCTKSYGRFLAEDYRFTRSPPMPFF